MISEPELTGGLDAPAVAGFDRPYRVPAQGRSSDDVVGGGGPGPVVRLRARLPRHWTWALGGVVAASAVWAGGIAVWQPGHHAPPDLHGYRLAEAPCTGASLQPLFTAASGNSPVSSGVVNVLRSSVVDAEDCTAYGTAVDGSRPTDAYTAALSVELHKTTDPRAEFEAEHTLPHGSLTAASTVQNVAGLGDKAYLLHQGPSLIGLEVLRGGVVVRLEFSVTPVPPASPAHPDGSPVPAPPRLDRFRPALTTAMRNVMAELQASRSQRAESALNSPVPDGN